VRLVYTGRYSAVRLEGVGRVKRDDDKGLDVPKEIAEGLLKRDPDSWKRASTPKAGKAKA